MTARAVLCGLLLGLAVLCLLAVVAPAQTIPTDVTGKPFNHYIDAPTGVPTTVTDNFPLPVTSAPPAKATQDPYGWGRNWIAGQTLNLWGNPAGGFFVDDSTVVAMQSGTNCIQQYRSTNAGRTFALVGQCFGAGSPQGTKQSQLAATNGNYVVALNTAAAGVTVPVITSTNGATWTAATFSGTAFTAGNAKGQAVFQGPSGTILVAVDNFQAASTGLMACRSTDNGLTFACTALSTAATGFLSGGQAIASPVSSTWLVASSNGVNTIIFRSTDDGATWTQVSSTVQSAGSNGQPAIGCFTSLLCVAVDGGTRILRSSDGGVTWTVVLNTASASQFVLVVLYDTAVGVAISENTDFNYRTTNAGVTWQSVPTVAIPDATSCTGAIGAPGSGGSVAVRKGRAVVWPGQSSGNRCYMFSPGLPAQGVGIVGQNGTLADVNALGQLGAYQGLGGTGAAAPWQQSAVQGAFLLNGAPTVSAANTAATVSLAGTAGTRVCIRSILVFATGATGNVTVTAQDGATIVWDAGVAQLTTLSVPTSYTFFAFCGSTGNSMQVNIGAGPTGLITHTSVIADRQ